MTRSLLALIALLAGVSASAQGHAGSCTCGGPAAPRVQWEIEHADNAFAAAAAAEFEKWNAYVDLFTYRSGDGVTGPNGTNEILFLDAATASSKYGFNFGGDVFAMTYMTPLSASGEFDACPRPPEATCGTFAETDVILNASFFRGFKPNGPPDFEDRGPALYGATAAHELGHALGFHHNFQNVSVMNYYEDFAALYIAASDTQEARRAYPAQARTITDLATYPFSFDATLTDYAATKPVVVSPAVTTPQGALTIRNFGLENTGSETVANADLRFYLSEDATITTSDILLGSLTFSGPLPAGAFWDDEGAGRTFSVPRDLVSGTYFVGALIPGAAGALDAVAYNNGWVAPQRVVIVQPSTRRRAVHK